MGHQECGARLFETTVRLALGGQIKSKGFDADGAELSSWVIAAAM